MLIDLIKYFVTNLVDKPEQIKIAEIQVNNKNIIEIRVDSKDLAKVIGKEGQIFKALRGLIKVIEPQSNKDLVVDVGAG